MKKLTILLTIVLFAIVFVNAQIRWPFGAANTISGGSNDTLDISSELTRGLNYYAPTNDTTLLINVTTVDAEWEVGELLIIKATEGTAAADTIRYGTNITGLEDAIPSGKTKIITFIWNGTAWVKLSTNQIN